METIKDKLKAKLSRLLEEGVVISYLEATRYEREPIKIDRIKICLNSFSRMDDGFEKEFWERAVYIDFERNPILSGDDTEEIYRHLLGVNESALELYLSE